MKRAVRFFLGCLITLPITAQGLEVRIGSWNLQYFTARLYETAFDRQNLRRTQTELHVYRRTIEQMDADVIAIQEAVDAQSLLSIAPPGYRVVFSEQPSHPGMNIGNNIHNALLVNPRMASRLMREFTLLDSVIPYQEKQDGKMVDRSSRAFVGIEFQAEQGSIVVLSVHLKVGCEGSQIGNSAPCKVVERQLGRLSGFLQSLKWGSDGVQEVWIVGDFNLPLQKDNLAADVERILKVGLSAGSTMALWPRATRTHCPTTDRSRNKVYERRHFIDYILCISASESLCGGQRFREFGHDEGLIRAGAVLSDHCPITVDRRHGGLPSYVQHSISLASVQGASKMSRVTEMEKDDKSLQVITDETGTHVLHEDGTSGPTYGDDRHDEVVERYEKDGWDRVGDFSN